MSFDAFRVKTTFVAFTLLLAGCPEPTPPPACEEATACDDRSACTIDACEGGECAHTAVNADDGNACTVDSCVPGEGTRHVPVVVDDLDPCTQDACDPLTGLSHVALELSDGNACTVDSCDAVNGIVHTVLDPNDGDVCTTDSCESTSGPVHVLVDVDDHDACTIDVCDQSGISHAPVDPSDGNACTVDSCDSTTGVHHVALDVDDRTVCTIDSCDPDSGPVHVLVLLDDSNACTIDSCDSVAGVAHTPFSVDDSNACTTDSCSPSTGVAHVAVAVDDQNACTFDSCNASTGVSHVPVVTDDQNVCTTDSCDPATGVSHVAVNVNDQNACTFDSCNASTGVSHVPVVTDDQNVCTTDSCDPATGVSHVALPIQNDNLACTDDVCDPVLGMRHLPVNTRCEVDGLGCTVAVCSTTSGCSETPTNSMCDDGIACNQHRCVGASGDSAGCAPKTPIDASCEVLKVCKATGCATQEPADQRGAVIVSEFSALGTEVIELRNTTASAIDVHGYVLKNLSGTQVELRAVTDLSGSAGTSVLIPANGQMYGVKNPSSGAPESGAGFVYGAPGTTFALADTGDVLSLYAAGGFKLEDTVNFSSFVTSATVAPAADSFVGYAGATSQLTPSALSAMGNDSAASWCVTFASSTLRKRFANTLGAANGSCSAVVLNEVMMRSATSDDGQTFVELAGPGGASVSGFSILDLASNGTLVVDGDLGAGETDGVVKLPAGTRLPADGYLLVADGLNSGANGFAGTSVANFTSGVDVIVRDLDLSNGPGAVQLLAADGGLVDVVGHDPSSSPLVSATAFNGLPTFEGSVAKTPAAGQSLARSAESADTDTNANDFRALSLTPGTLNKIPGASLSVHLTLGQPDTAMVDVSMPEKYLMLKPQFVISYNGARKNPNYVAYQLNSGWKGFASRQDDFRVDSSLPVSIPQAVLSDYSSSGWDRGHMCASDDRDVSVPDNSATFLLTNMIPQAPGNNQGPWRIMEAYLQCLAVVEGKEIFVATGGLYEGATQYTKSGSTVMVPSHTWKVATILGAVGQGPDDVTALTRTISVILPNDQATSYQAWRNYRVSVRDVEARTGYDFHSDVAPLTQNSIEASSDAVPTTCTCPAGLSCASGTY